jgi:hypothetical protein
MATFSFVLLIQGTDLLAADNLDALVEAGCDDAVFGKREGGQYADFDRDADTFPQAVISAITAVRTALPDAAIVRVEPDDLVSLTEIAERTGRSKESIRLLAEGKRGPGGFPPAVAWIAQKHRIWRWSEVVEWFARELGEQLAASESAQFIAALNGVLQANWHARQLAPSERRAVAEALEPSLSAV